MLVKIGKILCAKLRVFHIITCVNSYSIYILDVQCNSEVVVDDKLNYTVPHKNVTLFIFVISLSFLKEPDSVEFVTNTAHHIVLFS